MFLTRKTHPKYALILTAAVAFSVLPASGFQEAFAWELVPAGQNQTQNKETSEQNIETVPVYPEELLAEEGEDKTGDHEKMKAREAARKGITSKDNDDDEEVPVYSRAQELRERARELIKNTRSNLQKYVPTLELAEPPKPAGKPVPQETDTEPDEGPLMEMANEIVEDAAEGNDPGMTISGEDIPDESAEDTQVAEKEKTEEPKGHPTIPDRASEDMLSDDVPSENLLKAPGYATALGKKAVPVVKVKKEKKPIATDSGKIRLESISEDPFDKRIVEETPVRVTSSDIRLRAGNVLLLEDAIALGLKNAPQIDVRNEQIKQAEFSVEAAKADFLPDIQFTYEFGRAYRDPSTNANTTGGDQSMQDRKSLVFSQKLFDGLRTQAEVKRTRKLVKQANVNRILTMETVTRNVIEAYVDVLQYQKTRDDAQNFISEMRNLVSKISEMERAGNLSRARLNLAQSRLASALTAFQNANASYNDAVSNLELLTGELPDFEAVEPLSFDAGVYNIDTFLDFAETNNLQIILNKITEEALQHDYVSERGTYFPEINVVARGDESYNKTEDPKIEQSASVLLEANWVLFDGFSRRASMNEIKSQIHENRYQLENTLREVIRDVKLAYNQTVSLKQSIGTQLEDIDKNEELQLINKQSFELGDVDIFELIEEEQRIFNSKARLHELIRERFYNEYSLLLITGLLRPEDFKHTLKLQSDGKRVEF